MSVLALILLATSTVAQTPEKVSTARITSHSTYYDRKEGLISFTGNVFVDDEEYKLHADRAYVFLEGTNDLKRVVALGNVAMTNGTRRAYGTKASYYRNPGMVVLYGSDDTLAEVYDGEGSNTRTVRGKKIKFWTVTGQIEVLESELTSPRQGGVSELKGMLGR